MTDDKVSLVRCFGLSCDSRSSDSNCAALIYFCSCPLVDNGGEKGTGSTVLHLSSELFTGLFGSESALVKSVVILFCSPNGNVYYAPFKSICRKNKEIDWIEFNLFCSTSQSVTGIQNCKLKMKVVNKMNENEMHLEDDEVRFIDGLLVCGRDGGSTVTLMEEASSVLVPLIVPGPVIDWFVYGGAMYLSTGKYMYHLQLEVARSESGGLDVSITRRRGLHVANVVKVGCLPDPSTVTGKCFTGLEINISNILAHRTSVI